MKGNFKPRRTRKARNIFKYYLRVLRALRV